MLEGTQPRRKRIDNNLLTIRALIPLVLFGFLLTLIALLIAGWPTGQFGQQNVETVPHYERFTRPLVGEGETLTLPRRILDVAFYLVLLAGFAFLFLTWRRGNRSSLMGLIGVGILGLSYASGMALYNGAFVSMCGFLLILFSGIVMLTVVRDDEDVETETDLTESESTQTGTDSLMAVEEFPSAYRDASDTTDSN